MEKTVQGERSTQSRVMAPHAARNPMYAECAARVQRAGHLSDVLGCTIALADIRIAQGRLHEARRTYEHALQLAAEQGEPVLRGTADMCVGLSELYRERNDLHAATQLQLQSSELGTFAGLPQNPYRWCVAMARIREAHGDLAGALDLLDEAERLYMGDFFPNVRPVAALKTRVWLRQGKVGDALSWARERGLSTKDQLSYLREFEHITLARALLARWGKDQESPCIEEAIEFLNRLLQAAEDGGRMGSVIEILILLALAHQAHDDLPAALILLQRALILAEPEGYVRLLVDEGPPMAALLHVAVTRAIVPACAGVLLAALQSQDPTSADSSQVPNSTRQPISEPLSQRELDVLRLFNSELSGPDIARELVVALSTVRTHTKSIYGKLGVTSRHAAVKRAGELGLI